MGLFIQLLEFNKQGIVFKNLVLILILLSTGFIMAQKKRNKYRDLTPNEEQIIIHKGTEQPFTGKYNNHTEEGIYTCRQCGLSLYTSGSKFGSHCGWPSFDDEIPGAVKRVTDPDGIRTEILCNRCDAHLGHVFLGEGLTDMNVRHCVNSISLDFIAKEAQKSTQTAIYAGGCFWGMEYYFQETSGVLSTKVGYIGGSTENPTYEEVCSHSTGHAEAIEITFDPEQTTFEELTKLFFEIHDPGQYNRQGPDIGDQYRSAIFYLNDEQKKTAEKLIQILKTKGHQVVTELHEAGKFWKAELYHQDYYKSTSKQPYCHIYQKRF